MEPERKIEKWLRAFAKKRREETDGSFELHPATRRMLQGEVARQRSATRPASSGSFLRFFGRMRPSRVFALCFVASLVVSATLIIPSLGTARKKTSVVGLNRAASRVDESPRTLAKEKAGTRSLPVAAPETITNALLADSRARGKDASRNSGTAQPGLTLDATPLVAANEPARRMPGSAGEDRKTEAMAGNTMASTSAERNAIQADSVKRLDPAAFTAPASIGATSATFPQTPSATAGAATTRLEESADAARGADLSATQRYSQGGFAGNAQNRFKNNVAPSKAAPVLANFEVQQIGSTVAVVDEDGSVYKGYLVSNESVTESAPALAQSRIASPKILEQSTPLKRASEANEAAQTNYSFRVSGVNRSLKQNVVFTGNFIYDSNAAPQQNYAGGGGAGAASQKNNAGQLQQMLKNSAQQSLFSNSRIAGTAVVGNTNAIEINAVPVQ